MDGRIFIHSLQIESSSFEFNSKSRMEIKRDCYRVWKERHQVTGRQRKEKVGYRENDIEIKTYQMIHYQDKIIFLIKNRFILPDY